MDTVLKWREPAAVIVLVALAIRLVIGGAALVGYAGPGGGRLVWAASSLHYLVVDSVGVVVLALLVASCLWYRPTPHARALGTAAVVLVALAILGSIALGVTAVAVGRAVGIGDLPGLVLGLVLPTLALGALLALRRDGSAAEVAPAAIEAGGPAEVTAPEAGPARPAYEQQASWEPDEAAGVAWQSAGAAAAGAAASGWGTPGSTAGWTPVPGLPAGETPSAIGWQRLPGGAGAPQDRLASDTPAPPDAPQPGEEAPLQPGPEDWWRPAR